MKFTSSAMKLRIMAGNEPRWIRQHKRRAYIVASFLSTPLWCSQRDFKALAERARLLGHVLDHIVPVTHPFVCGLTVPWNMQVVPRAVNAAKSNRFAPDQLPLALPHEPAQLALPLSAGRTARRAPARA